MLNPITTLYFPIYQHDNLISLLLIILIGIAFKCRLAVHPTWYPLVSFAAIIGLIFNMDMSSLLSIPWMMFVGILAYHAGSKFHFDDNDNDDDWRRGGDDDPDSPRFPWGEFDDMRKHWENTQTKV